MRKPLFARLALISSVFLAGVSTAQPLDRLALDSVRTFRSLEKALVDPDQVYRLDLSHTKLKELPEGVRGLTRLNAIDLGRNKLRQLPEWFGELKDLQELVLHRNKLVEFPEQICKLHHLKRLDMSRNSLTGLPACMSGLTELVSLDLWSNDLAEFPDELVEMEEVRHVDLRVIQFSSAEMERIIELFPRAKIHFSAPCNCGL